MTRTRSTYAGPSGTRMGRRAARSRRRRGGAMAALAALAALAVVAASGLVWLVRGSGGSGSPPPTGPSRLLVLAVRADPEPLVAIVGARGEPEPAAVVVPAGMFLTIPGQGDGTVADAAALPGPSLAATLSNAVGAWIDHYAVAGEAGLAGMVDRAGGIRVELAAPTGPSPSAPPTATLSGEQVVGYLSGTEGAERLERWRRVLDGLLAEPVAVEASDLADVDDLDTVAGFLAAARGADAAALPVTEVTGGLLLPDEDAVRALMAAAFGVPDRAPVPVIVLNGSGAPGVGQAVAEALVPSGFRIVDSGNAASFDHRITSILAATEDDLAAAERVRDLLGVGEVTVSGLPSGLGDVTIVVGRDFASG
ncbi:MAG: LCP family protein [Actinobacteria bacterium]|nr:LCP family protein [Actinomycetota bacterium]